MSKTSTQYAKIEGTFQEALFHSQIPLHLLFTKRPVRRGLLVQLPHPARGDPRPDGPARHPLPRPHQHLQFGQVGRRRRRRRTHSKSEARARFVEQISSS